MGEPYVPLDWNNIGSSMTPFISIQFRGSSYIHTFPNPTNRIYIANANFEVMNDAGASTASITLIDPDFINLEGFFARAIVTANRSSKVNGYWFCRVFWGWTYYGKQVDFHNGGKGQAKHSGIHAYMLKDLRYDLDEVELKVTFELIDLGEGLLNGRHNEPDPSVGNLDIDDEPTDGTTAGAKNSNYSAEAIKKNVEDEAYELVGQDWIDEIKNDRVLESGVVDGTELHYPEDASSNEGASTDELPNAENIFFNRTPWYILKTVLKKWWAKNNPEDEDVLSVTWDTTIEGDSENGPFNQKPLPKHVIGSSEGIKHAIETLLDNLYLEGFKAVMMAGVKLIGSNSGYSPVPGMVFGWQPRVPTQPMDDLAASEMFRKARTFVFRPGNKEQVAKGQTMINNLSYEWTSKGFYLMGLPQLYAITTLNDGSLKVYSSRDEFSKASADEKSSIYYMSTDNAESEGVTAVQNKISTALDLLPTRDPNNLSQKASNKTGAYEVEFNYDTREGDEVTVDETGRKLIINVWNKFAKELFDVTVSLPGDPWLDNSIWNIHGENDSRNEKYLVNLYNSYFKIAIYRPLKNNQNTVSKLITGNYLCLKGCSHSISEGEYTTSLKLIKAW